MKGLFKGVRRAQNTYRYLNQKAEDLTRGELRELTTHDEYTVYFGCHYFTIHDSPCTVYGESWHTPCQKTVDRPTGLCTLYGKYALNFLVCVGHILII